MSDMFYEILWGRFTDVERVFSLPRSTTYNLIKDGVIRSRLVRRKGQRGCGMRLIDMQSVRDFLENAPEKTPKRISDRMRERAYISADARATQDEE
jgi:hypothetical protein